MDKEQPVCEFCGTELEPVENTDLLWCPVCHYFNGDKVLDKE